MDHLIFECLSKEDPTSIEEVAKGWKYLSLYEHSQKSKQGEGNGTAFRCAVSIPCLYIISHSI